jgi:hypothetical protein
VAIAAFAVLFAFRDASDTEAGSPLAGAIFTTTWDGSIVNENVRYQDKKEVYLDGGPPPNAPQTAAGLPDGLYVFQVTDPSGRTFCRRTRPSAGSCGCRTESSSSSPPSSLGMGLTDTYDPPGPTGPFPCHIQDEPPGIGPSGRHDTNTDIDHGPPAIVVQLMPFRDTPNPGGVYKAWVTPLVEYLIKDGNLNPIPHELKVKGKFVGFFPDDGFGPPRDAVKTDNFKVKGQPVSPMLHVRKVNDRNGNGVIDPGEPLITGWPIDITDPTGVTNATSRPWTLSPTRQVTTSSTRGIPQAGSTRAQPSTGRTPSLHQTP